jgi:hypothetical protein
MRPRFRNNNEDRGFVTSAALERRPQFRKQVGVIQPPMEIAFDCPHCGERVPPSRNTTSYPQSCASCKNIVRTKAKVPRKEYMAEPWFKKMWPGYTLPEEEQPKQVDNREPKAFNSGERKPTLGEIVGNGNSTAPKRTGDDFNSKLQRVIDNGREIDIDYQGFKDPEARRRTIIPTSFNDTHVRAYDAEAGMHKTFNRRNLLKVHVTRPSSVQPIPVDPEPLVAKPSPAVTKSPNTPVTKAPNTPVKKMEPKVRPSDRVEPTDAENEEIKSMDIDPRSFDRATHKKLRSLGATHEEIKDALRNGAFIEDYLDARTNVNNHASALDAAMKYQDYTNNVVNSNKQYVQEKWAGKIRPAPDENVNRVVEKLFNHHLVMKNRARNIGSTTDETNPERSHEWLLSELTKLSSDPNLKSRMNESRVEGPEDFLSSAHHDGECNGLMNHFHVKRLLSNNAKEFTINNRLVNALSNVSGGHQIVNGYSDDKYEED